MGIGYRFTSRFTQFIGFLACASCVSASAYSFEIPSEYCGSLYSVTQDEIHNSGRTEQSVGRISRLNVSGWDNLHIIINRERRDCIQKECSAFIILEGADERYKSEEIAIDEKALIRTGLDDQDLFADVIGLNRDVDNKILIINSMYKSIVVGRHSQSDLRLEKNYLGDGLFGNYIIDIQSPSSPPVCEK